MFGEYYNLLRKNRNYRLLFCGSSISCFGDWFTSIAVLSILGHEAGVSALAIAMTFVLRMLPTFVVSPVGGWLADRYDRRKILLACDYLRAILVLVILLAPFLQSTALIYVVLALQSVIAAAFDPARSALVPSVVGRDNIVTANALNGVVWSSAIIFGSALGGVATEYFGWEWAIIFDSVSYLLSAICVLRMDLDITGAVATAEGAFQSSTTSEFVRFLMLRPDATVALLVKGFYGIGGAMYLVLVLYGQRVFTVGSEGAIGISMFWMARGIGALSGALLINPLLPARIRERHFLVIILGMVGVSAGYVLLGLSSSISLAVFAVFLGHVGGQMVWTWSSSMLQHRFSPSMRGRAHGLEFGFFMLTTSISSVACAMMIDDWNLSPQGGAVAVGGALGGVGLLLIYLRSFVPGLRELGEVQTSAVTGLHAENVNYES